MGGGDPLLGHRGQMTHERIAATGIEFAKDVVHQIDRHFSTASFEQLALGEFQSQCEGALLAFAGIVGGGHAVDSEVDFIAVGTDDGLAQAGFAFASLQQ